MSKKIRANEYVKLLQDVKQRIHSAQYEALKAVNKELTLLYWDIGRIILGRQKKHGWGKSVVETLAKDLQKEFQGVWGFSSQNLWYMRQFYTEYHKKANLQPLVGEISWAKHLIIMGKCRAVLHGVSALARLFGRPRVCGYQLSGVGACCRM